MTSARSLKPIKYSVYSAPEELDRAGTGAKIAHFLMWASSLNPKEIITYVRIAQYIHKLKSPPRVDSAYYKAVVNSLPRAAEHLRVNYQRDLFTENGIGCRATYSADDAALGPGARKLKRVDSARRSLEATMNIVDRSKLRDPKAKRLVAFIDSKIIYDLADIRKEIQNLLPPKQKKE